MSDKCTWMGYDDDDAFIGCTAVATHWSGHRGDHVGEGPVCVEHRCRHGGMTLEERERFLERQIIPSEWMTL